MLNIQTNGTSPDVSTCEELRISAALEAEDGTVVNREKIVLVYHEIMRDSEQLPFMIAETLRSLMNQVDEAPKRII